MGLTYQRGNASLHHHRGFVFNTNAGSTAVILTFMTLVWLTLGTATARADCQSPKLWEDYTNPRFGVRIDIPVDCFSPLPPPVNQDGREFVSVDGLANFGIYGAHNVEGYTPHSLKRWLIDTLGDYDQITYEPMGKSWFVLSGYRGDDIFYEKYLFSHDVKILNAFWITFPRKHKPIFAPIIERMENSFRSGHGLDTP